MVGVVLTLSTDIPVTVYKDGTVFIAKLVIWHFYCLDFFACETHLRVKLYLTVWWKIRISVIRTKQVDKRASLGYIVSYYNYFMHICFSMHIWFLKAQNCVHVWKKCYFCCFSAMNKYSRLPDPNILWEWSLKASPYTLKVPLGAHSSAVIRFVHAPGCMLT